MKPLFKRMIQLFIVTIVFTFFSCNKKEIIEPSTANHFMIQDSEEHPLTIELSWKVEGHEDGDNYVNLDLYVGDTIASVSRDLPPVYAYGLKPYGQPEILNNLLYYLASVERKERVYLGVVANGITPMGLALNKDLTIEWTIKVGSLTQTELFSGSFILDSDHANKTVVHNIYTVDAVGGGKFGLLYSFRSLEKIVVVVRASDFVEDSLLNDTRVPGLDSYSSVFYKSGYVISLEWKVDGQYANYSAADLDLHLIQYPTSSDGGEARSTKSSGFESVNMDNRMIGEYDFAAGYALNSFSLPSGTLEYTISISTAINPFRRYIYHGTITSPATSSNTDKLICPVLLHENYGFDSKSITIETLPYPLLFDNIPN